MMLVLIQRVYIHAIWLIVTCGLLLVTVNSDLVPVCPDGWHEHNTQCYWFSDFNATRDDAQIECEARNSSLVTINTSNINNFLQQHISNKTNYWIGLKIDIITDTYKWQWSSGKKVLTSHYRFINWCDGHTVGTACAVAVYSNTEPQQICYESSICVTKQRYVCEKEKFDLSSCPDGWDEHTYASYSTKCYYVSGNTLRNEDAARFCWSQGARLITITYTGPDSYLRCKKPGRGEVFWIGLSPYTWDDGTPYNWNNWDSSGPSIGAKCTLLQQDGSWHHGTCSGDLHYFICQKDAIEIEQVVDMCQIESCFTIEIPCISTTHSPEITTVEPIFTTQHKNETTSTNPYRDETASTTYTYGDETFRTTTDSCTCANDITSAMEENSASQAKTFYIVISILSVIIVCLVGSLVAMTVYLKRQLVSARPPILQDAPYQDIGSMDYDHVNTTLDVGNQSKLPVQRHSNLDETITADLEMSRVNYEQLSSVSNASDVHHQLHAQYATLEK